MSGQSWQLRAYKVFARWFQKPALTYVRPQTLARRLFDLNALLTYERPAGVRLRKTQIGGVDGAWVDQRKDADAGVLLFVHGGAFVIGSPRSYRTLVARLAKLSGRHGYIVDYRLAPEHPFPAALTDVIATYRGLLEQGHQPETIALVGDSAGGCLVLALLHMLGQEGLPMPAKAGLLSPITDLRLTNPSLTENLKKDPLISPTWGLRGVRDYLNGQSPDDPQVSPILGAFSGCCPVMFQVGEDEVLRDDSVLMSDHLSKQGVDVTLKVWPHVPHVWHLMSGRIPEADAGLAEMGAFLRG